MNPLLPYEQTIAAKLEELPPNLLEADAIWADIEAQLDGDLPSGDDNPPANPQPSGGGNWAAGIKLSLGAAALALATYWFIQVGKPATDPNPVSTIPAEKKPPIGDTAQQVPIAKPLPKTAQPTMSNASIPFTNNPMPNQTMLLPVQADSLRLLPLAVPTAQKDSTAAPITTPNLALPPPGKKKRGTQGIQDSDYKFVQGKDST